MTKPKLSEIGAKGGVEGEMGQPRNKCELQAVPQVLHTYQTWVVRMPGVFRGWGAFPKLFYTIYCQPHVNIVIQ